MADAGLGCLNGVRLSMAALEAVPAGRPPAGTVVVLDRFDEGHELHRRNRDWLADRDGYRVAVVPGGEAGLVDLVAPGRDRP